MISIVVAHVSLSFSLIIISFSHANRAFNESFLSASCRLFISAPRRRRFARLSGLPLRFPPSLSHSLFRFSLPPALARVYLCIVISFTARARAPMYNIARASAKSHSLLVFPLPRLFSAARPPLFPLTLSLAPLTSFAAPDTAPLPHSFE